MNYNTNYNMRPYFDEVSSLLIDGYGYNLGVNLRRELIDIIEKYNITPSQLRIPIQYDQGNEYYGPHDYQPYYVNYGTIEQLLYYNNTNPDIIAVDVPSIMRDLIMVANRNLSRYSN